MNKPILDTIKETCEIFGKYELTKGELARAEELAYKLENQKITVSVIGQFKRGKSTLVNSTNRKAPALQALFLKR